MSFVRSTDVPDWLAVPVAEVAHRRGCGHFDGRRSHGPPPFTGRHADRDVFYARLHIADLLGAFDAQPDDLAFLLDSPTPCPPGA